METTSRTEIETDPQPESEGGGTAVLEAPPQEEHTAEPAADTIEAAADTATLKAVSLWQPWASLIAIGAKRIETRSWKTSHRGPIAILATAKTRKDDEDLCVSPGPINDALVGAGIVSVSGDEIKLQIPVGAVVAVADLVDCFEFAEGFDPGEPEKHFGDFLPGRYGWKLENVRKLPEPIACSGGQRIFNLPADVAEKVAAALAAIPAFEPKPLSWRFDDVLEVYIAPSVALVDGDRLLEYRAGATEGGGWHVEGSFAALLVEPRPKSFPTLEEAQAWCQQREDELAKWASDKPTPTAASEAARVGEPAPSVAEAVKVGSDGGHNVASPDADMWADITEARHEERAAEDEVESLSDELKEAKKRLEKASERLGRLIDDAETGQQRLKFPAPTAEPFYPVQTPAAVCESTSNITENITDPADDAWKATPITALKPALKPSIVAKLADHEPKIETVGALAQWMNDKGDHWATDIKGIGPKAREEIEDAMSNFWAKRAEAKPAAPLVEPESASVAEDTNPAAAGTVEEPPPSPDTAKTAAELGLAPGRVAAACHVDILARFQAGKVPDLRDVIELGAVTYVVTPPPIPFTNDHDLYALRPLFSSVGGEPSPDDEYRGIKVARKGSFFYVGPVHLIQLVRDGDGDGDKPAAKKSVKKATKKSVKKATKKKSRK